MRVPIGVSGEGFGVGFRGVVLLWKTREKGEGGGEVGGGVLVRRQGIGKLMRTRVSRLPFSKLRKSDGHEWQKLCIVPHSNPLVHPYLGPLSV